jgi:hypothetical protein
MKIEDCVNDTMEGFVSYDMQKIRDCIKNRDREFLEDLKMKLSVSSKAQDIITGMIITELLDDSA